ncbi:MAG: GNAT family N-acetyltransferase [Acidobacteria bacterium]|nr:GNAT family N-acetyltransferase [Acidobacteriota bacterium]MCW5949110.1 GNAT family N-acetyltransferase [Pyrinomonadaceae bacterium]
MRIRPIAPADIPELIRIADDTGLSPWTASNFLDELRLSNSIMLKLEGDEGEPGGFVVGRVLTDSRGMEPTEAELYNIAVIPSLQGHGFGQQVIDAFFEKCREANVKKVWLEVRAGNTRALDFYSRNGFSIAAKRPKLYTAPVEDGYLMLRTMD